MPKSLILEDVHEEGLEEGEFIGFGVLDGLGLEGEGKHGNCY